MLKRPIICGACMKPNPAGKECPWCAFREGRLRPRIERLRKKAARISFESSSVALLVCFNGHRWRAEVDPKRGIETSKFTCPEAGCGKESSVEDVLKVRFTNAKCRTRCWLASNPFKCVCSCGGANHGTGGPPLDAVLKVAV